MLISNPSHLYYISPPTVSLSFSNTQAIHTSKKNYTKRSATTITRNAVETNQQQQSSSFDSFLSSLDDSLSSSSFEYDDAEDTDLTTTTPYSITPSLTSIFNAKKQGLSIKNSTEFNTTADYFNYMPVLPPNNSFYSDDFEEDDELDENDEFSSCSSKSTPLTTSHNSISSPVTNDDHPLAGSMSDDGDILLFDEEEEDEEFCYSCTENYGYTENDIHSTSIAQPITTVKTNGLSKLFKKVTSFAQQISQQTLKYNQVKTADFLKFNERMTDDKFTIQQELQTFGSEIQPLQEQQEQQEAIQAPEQQEAQEEEEQEEVVIDSYHYHHRENRINSKFLRIYAHDYSSKLKGNLLSCNDDELDQYMTNPSSIPTPSELYNISILAREKLWTNVVLPPRSDDIGIQRQNSIVNYKKTGKFNQLQYQYIKKNSTIPNRLSCIITAA